MLDEQWQRKRVPDKNKNFNPQSQPQQSTDAGLSDIDTRTATIDDLERAAGKKMGKKQHWWQKLTKKQKIIIAVIGAIILIGGSVGAFFIFRKEPVKEQPKVVQPAPEPPKPTTEPSKLTGLSVALDVNKRQVTAIMIENSPDARPQSGLYDAGVVFEAVAEGGITRFLSLYQDTQPDYIGPVRSVRPYYLDWLVPFDAAVAHVGGSGDALSQIKSEGIKDLDQFSNSAAFERVSGRFAPHNVYTSIAKLNDLENKKGYTTSNFTGFERKVENPPTGPTNARSIDFSISAFLYNPHYDYDQATNSYKRSQAGKPHVDEKSGKQINPKVVIALVLNKGIASDGLHTLYTTTGSGKMYVFQDGVVSDGTWQKNDRKGQFKFTDNNGKTIALNPGYTWISIVAEPSAVKHQ